MMLPWAPSSPFFVSQDAGQDSCSVVAGRLVTIALLRGLGSLDAIYAGRTQNSAVRTGELSGNTRFRGASS